MRASFLWPSLVLRMEDENFSGQKHSDWSAYFIKALFSAVKK
jgi:hypothetical protein